MEYWESYEEFMEKFKHRMTTDDCYTPEPVYEAVKRWAVREYGIDESGIVRPFYPGGDYEHYDYPKGCVVLDNPPFSKLKTIIKFYDERGIDYFLFAPTLTILSTIANTGAAGKELFGRGVLLSQKGHKARAAADARLQEARKVIRWELSERERERKIIDEMSRKGGEAEEL